MGQRRTRISSFSCPNGLGGGQVIGVLLRDELEQSRRAECPVLDRRSAQSVLAQHPATEAERVPPRASRSCGLGAVGACGSDDGGGATSSIRLLCSQQELQTVQRRRRHP